MLQVTFYSIEGPSGGVSKVAKGTIVLDDNNKLHVNPTTPENGSLLNGISMDPITVIADDGEEVDYDPVRNPEDWILNLNRQYKSYALFATSAKEISDKK